VGVTLADGRRLSGGFGDTDGYRFLHGREPCPAWGGAVYEARPNSRVPARGLAGQTWHGGLRYQRTRKRVAVGRETWPRWPAFGHG